MECQHARLKVQEDVEELVNLMEQITPQVGQLAQMYMLLCFQSMHSMRAVHLLGISSSTLKSASQSHLTKRGINCRRHAVLRHANRLLCGKAVL